MNLALENTCVLVTGSSRGIGRGIAEAFLAEGAKVAISGRTPETLRDAAKELRDRYGDNRVVSVTADFSGAEADVKRAVALAKDALGGLDTVVANVGSGRGAAGLDADGDEWRRLLDLNLIGAATIARVAVPLLGRGGNVLFIASIAAAEALPAPLPYSAAKAGLVVFAKNLARELAPKGLRVNTISPGNVLHAGGSWAARKQRDPEGTDAYIRAEVPMGRFGMPEEIGAAAVFLASNRAASFITGANLVVDGGQSRSF